MLEVKNIHTYYDNIHALKGVSLHVEQGEIVTLIGSNGAGKTTTVYSITGVKTARQGDIFFEGESITKESPDQIVQRGVSLSPEGRQIFPKLSVLENLHLGAYVRKGSFKDSLEYVFSLFPRLEERIKQSAGTLSGGEQQMLAIGRALMAKPKLLLLDEPSLGLAPNLVLRIFDLIKEINKSGVSILLIEQNAKLSLSLAHRAYVLETGEIKLEGAGKELLQNPKVMELYLGGT